MPNRLPQTEAEIEELNALSSQGPYEVYKWIYGADNFFTQSVSGQSWKDLHVEDPIQGTQEIVDSLKSLEHSHDVHWVDTLQIYAIALSSLLFAGELMISKYLPNHGLDIWSHTLLFVLGLCLTIFVLARGTAMVFLRSVR